jgi:peptide/nickel transport system permease protein
MYTLVLLLLISFAVFTIFSLLPVDPAALTCGKNCTPEWIEQNRIRLGYNLPFYEQYWEFLKGIFIGRNYGSGTAEFSCQAPALGYSFAKGECVTTLVAAALPATFYLAIGAVTLWVGTGIMLGIWAARRRGGFADNSINVLTVIATSLPTFLTGQILLILMVSRFRILPYPEYVTPFEDPLQFLQTMILPWVTLALPGLAIYAKLTRGAVLDTGAEDYVRTARAKGLSERVILRKHTLRPALSPLSTLAAMDFAFMLGGAIITEKIFSIPGIGRLAIRAVVDMDLPVVVGTTLIAAFIIVVMNLIVDVLYAVIDPRVRVG